MDVPEIILVFDTNTRILNAEELLEDRGLPFELVPVPKEVNPNCGLAISFKQPAQAMIMPALAAANLLPSAAYRRQGGVFSDWPLT
ncbi:MAG: DUF3343 domain-containing protein [Deltaproteobacteria bacterium]|jgi:hypothetical protein|nr:DUF3343 domain-containing protein [Deltaproteobacteria bacterium]